MTLRRRRYDQAPASTQANWRESVLTRLDQIDSRLSRLEGGIALAAFLLGLGAVVGAAIIARL